MRFLPLIAILVLTFSAFANGQTPQRQLPVPNVRLLPQACGNANDCDGDGDSARTDCNDHDPARYHGNPAEHSRADRVDNDCDSSTLGPDSDHDGAVASAACNEQANGQMLCGADCDDTRPGINTSAVETCDLVDNNCNGRIDEGVQGTFFRDADGDGFGAGAVIQACFAPTNASLRATDCDDANPLTHPGQFELADRVDNNCNGQIDEPPLLH